VSTRGLASRSPPQARDGTQAASRRLISHSRVEMPLRRHPIGDLIGLKACTASTAPRLDRATRWRTRDGKLGSMPPCMQTSVAPADVRLPGAVGDPRRCTARRIGVALALGERAEPRPV